jgi:hypothetical protein
MFKKSLILIAVLVAAALALVVPAWPGTLPASIVPDGTRFVVHVDMEMFFATKLYKYLDKDGQFDVKSRYITRLMKVDLRKDITGLTVFGPEADGQRAVFAVAGKFDKERLLALVELDDTHQEISYGGTTIYSTGDHEFGAFINDGLIVIGERREDIEKVLDVAAGKAKNFASSKLHAAFKDLSAGAFVSGIIEDINGLGRRLSQSKLFSKASGMSFVAREKQDNLQLRVEAAADTPENAKNMADIAQGLIALVRLGKAHIVGQEARVASLFQDVQVKLEGKTIRLVLDMPSREFVDLVSHGQGMGSFFY